MNDTFESRDLVVFMKTGRAASIQSAAGDSKGGATSVFDRKVGGLTLTFQGFDSQLAVDRETRSTWNKSTGVAIQGELKGERLNRVHLHGCVLACVVRFLPRHRGVRALAFPPRLTWGDQWSRYALLHSRPTPQAKNLNADSIAVQRHMLSIVSKGPDLATAEVAVYITP